MMILPIPLGPEPAPDHRWVGLEVARRIRSRCTITGLLLLLWALVAGGAILLLGSRLPTAEHPIHGLGVLLAALSAMLLLAAGAGALGARRYVTAEHVNVAGGRALGRVLLAVAGGTLGTAALSSVVLLLTAAAVGRTAPAPDAVPAAGGYLALPVSCGVLAMLAGLLLRRLLARGEPGHPPQA